MCVYIDCIYGVLNVDLSTYIYTYMKTLRPINRKQGKTTNPNNSFFLRKEKRAARVGFEPTTHCLLGRCSNH